LTTTVAFALLAWGLLWFGLWTSWYLVRLPFHAWRRLARRQARTRLATGLLALHEGRWARAESLLVAAADEPESRAAALLGAREAALRRDDRIAAATHLTTLAKADPAVAALLAAEAQLGQGDANGALASLQPLVERRTLPPRGRVLLVEAQRRAGQAAQALERLSELRNEPALTGEELATLEADIGADAITQAGDVEVLDKRWQSLPPRLRDVPAVIAAYARRAVALGREDAAAEALVAQLEKQWEPDLVRVYGELPPDGRRERAEAWLADHPDDPALLLALGRLSAGERLWARAEEQLHRAVALGAGADAWEMLGAVHSAQGDSARAEFAYANALRVARGQRALAVGGRSLRDQIASEAVAELRNEHGLPLLRG
ncbi:MAG: heme biosynthesis protein HemY, partial [Arenimonas sp.]